MSKKEILNELKDAILDLDEEKVFSLFEKGLKEKLTPLEMISGGLNVGLAILGDGFEDGSRFMADLVVAGEIMTGVVEKAAPAIEKANKGKGGTDCMVIGSVQGDLHNIGKHIVCAVFAGSGYKVVDIGEDQEASAFVEAVKKYKPVVVGASSVLGPTKAYCKVVAQALEDAGLRDDVVYAIGGWGFTQEWCDKVGADCFALLAMEGLNKVKAIRSGEVKKLKDRNK